MCSPWRVLRWAVAAGIVLVVYARVTASPAKTTAPATVHVPVTASSPQVASLPYGAIIAGAIAAVLLLAALYVHRSRRRTVAVRHPAPVAVIPAVTHRTEPGTAPLASLDLSGLDEEIAALLGGQTGGSR